MDFSEKQIEYILKTHTSREILGEPRFTPKLDFEEDSPGLVYDMDFYIIIFQDQYMLIIENGDWISCDLCFLEEILAEYKLRSGSIPAYMYS